MTWIEIHSITKLHPLYSAELKVMVFFTGIFWPKWFICCRTINLIPYFPWWWTNRKTKNFKQKQLRTATSQPPPRCRTRSDDSQLSTAWFPPIVLLWSTNRKHTSTSQLLSLFCRWKKQEGEATRSRFFPKPANPRHQPHAAIDQQMKTHLSNFTAKGSYLVFFCLFHATCFYDFRWSWERKVMGRRKEDWSKNKLLPLWMVFGKSQNWDHSLVMEVMGRCPPKQVYIYCFHLFQYCRD